MKDLRDEIKPKKMKAVDPISQILDEENYDNVVLYDPEKKPIEFEQVAVIPVDDEKTDEQTLYTIMIPITPMQGVSEGEGVVFKIDESSHDIEVVNDEKIIDKVLEIYQQLLMEGGGDKGKE